MDDQEIIQARLKEIMLIGETGTKQLEELLHRQHYDFAHKLVPYLAWERFDELIRAFENDSAQEWINEIWSNLGDAPLESLSVTVYPICQLKKISSEIGVIYFAMPAPRTTGEVVYSSIVFLMDQEPSSLWLRRYFTLELGAYIASSSSLEASPAHWTLAEWDTSKHLNYGEFPLSPTLGNFLSKIIDIVQENWY
jgi:hypothetical protein